MTEQDQLTAAIVEMRTHVERLFQERDRLTDKLETERDLRYQQRWEAQVKAVTDAMLAAEKAIAAALTAAEKAVLKAETAANGVTGELRDALGKMEQRFTEKIEDVVGQQNVTAGRNTGSSATWAYVIAIAGIVIAALALLSR